MAGKTFPALPAYATRKFAYLVRGPYPRHLWEPCCLEQSFCRWSIMPWQKAHWPHGDDWLCNKRTESTYARPPMHWLMVDRGWDAIFTEQLEHIHIEAETKWPPFSDDILKWIFFNENVWVLIKISLKFVPRGPINNIPALAEIKAWRRPGDKPLSEPMLPTHICAIRPQWVNTKTHQQSWRLYCDPVTSYCEMNQGQHWLG